MTMKIHIMEISMSAPSNACNPKKIGVQIQLSISWMA